MNRRKRILIAIFSPIIAIIATIAMLPVASPARAQEPETICITGTNISVNPSTYLGVNQTAEYGYIVNPSNLLGPPDGAKASIYDWDKHPLPTSATCGYYGLPGVVSTVEESDIITITAFYSRVQYDNLLWTTAGTSPAIVPDGVPADAELRDFDYFTSTVPFTGSVGALMLCVIHTDVSGSFGNEDIDAITVTVKGQYCYSETIAAPACDTVTDYHFTGTPTDTWTLEGDATIFSSTLIINNDGMAAQNLVTDTIISDIPYNAAISVTTVTAPTDLLVWLHDVTQTVSITQPGLYTATFTITSSVAGQSAGFLLWNVSDTGLAIDWTCIYTGTRDFEEGFCLSGLPLNRTFSTNDYWKFHRGAEWQSTQENIFLPYDTEGLIEYTPTLTLPTIYPGEHLLMSFDARGTCSEDGLISTRASITRGSIYTGSDYLADTFLKTYTYEADLSLLAGEQGVELFFANPGLSGCMGYTSTDHVILDNVCIFIASRPISLPYQTDPDEADFIDPACAIGGLAGLSDCGQVDEIWALFGVNMAYYRAVYAAGASVWDPVGWVPWLISAIFVTLADWSCFFLAAYIGLMNFLGWMLNNILNIFDWIRRYLTRLLTYVNAFLEWLHDWFWFYWAVFYDFVSWLIDYAAYWISFISLSWDTFWSWGATTVMYWVGWITIALGWLDDWVNNFWDSVRVYLSGQFYFVQEIYNFIVAAINMAVTFLWWIWTNFVAVGQLPINFYWGFNNAINSTAYTAFISCGGETSFWCVFLAGVQIINQTMSQSVFYPIVIVCIILATVVILWRDIRGIFSA